MSKFDGEIRAVGEAVEVDDLSVALARLPRLANRQDALSQYLSAGEGWRDARAMLRGAFAEEQAPAAGLTGNSEQ